MFSLRFSFSCCRFAFGLRSHRHGVGAGAGGLMLCPPGQHRGLPKGVRATLASAVLKKVDVSLCLALQRAPDVSLNQNLRAGRSPCPAQNQSIFFFTFVPKTWLLNQVFVKVSAGKTAGKSFQMSFSMQAPRPASHLGLITRDTTPDFWVLQLNFPGCS